MVDGQWLPDAELDPDGREQVEHRLRQREAELIGFAGIVAHDLRGPLAPGDERAGSSAGRGAGQPSRPPR